MLGDGRASVSCLVSDCDELSVGPCKIFGEESVGTCQLGQGSAISSGSSSKICNGVDCILLVFGDVLGAIPGSLGFCLECFAVFLIGESKIGLELCPRLVRRRFSLPNFAVIREDARAKNKLISNV